MATSRITLFSLLCVFAALGIVLGGTAAHAETHIVQMLNKHPETKARQVFYPPVLRAKVGDTVRFVSADKGHNSQSIAGMLPEGAKPWKSKINKDFEITLTQEGTYGYKCTPHYGLGMVGLILVGDFKTNLELAKSKKNPGKARKVFAELFESL